jgi:hypothetical protein
VLGKLLAGLLGVLVMVAAAIPLFAAITLFGGVSSAQVVRVFLVTLCSALMAGSLGAMIAFAREKTFQTLALTVLCLLIWLGWWEAVHYGMFFRTAAGFSSEVWAQAFSPMRAIFAAAKPELESGIVADFGRGITPFLCVSAAICLLLNAWTALRVRVWNPSREVRIKQDEDETVSIWGAEHDLTEEGDDDRVVQEAAEKRRSGHVDARVRTVSSKSRKVWDNPILWREMCTWAYGRKVLAIRLVYGLLFVGGMLAMNRLVTSGAAAQTGGFGTTVCAAFFLVSLVIINALAVTSITNERDGLALDLLLVTDLDPREFVFGKLLGVLWVTREMVLLPLALVGYLGWLGAINGEQCVFLITGLLVMDVFVAMLGIHCGMSYANSRSAIGVSLGTVFFLFLGVVTCIAMMVSFAGSFQSQLAPFLAFIGGGSVGLFLSLGVRNPSPAILFSSLLLPWATFNAITSYLLGQTFSVFFVLCATYGFTTAALLIPAIGEFDIAMGRTKTAGDE